MEIPADSIDAEGTAAVPVTVPLPILCGGEIAVEAAREFMERQVKAAIVRHDHCHRTGDGIRAETILSLIHI